MAQTENKIYLFEQMPIRKAVMKLGLPAVAVSLVTVIYSLADTWFVGMLNDPVQNAAVTLAAPLLLLFYAVNNLFGMGTTSMMGRALGRKEYDTARRCAAFGFWAAALCSLMISLVYAGAASPILRLLGAEGENRDPTAAYLFWTVTLGAAPSILNVILGYLVRCEGSAVHSAVGTMSGCILNIFLDPIFVLPRFLGMGAAGAGCATFISNCVACLYFLILLLVRRKNTFVCLNPVMAAPRREIAPGIFAVGIPMAIQNLLNVTGMTILNNFAASYGITSAVAAIGIAYKVHMIPMQVSFGMTGGVTPLISYNYGAGNYGRVRKTVVFTGALTTAFLIATAACFALFARPLMGGFSQVPDIISYGTIFLRIMIIGIPFQCIDFLSVNVFQSFGNGRYALIFAILRKIVMEIPLLVLIQHTIGLFGLPLAQTVTEVILCFAALVCMVRAFRRLESGKNTSLAG